MKVNLLPYLGVSGCEKVGQKHKLQFVGVLINSSFKNKSPYRIRRAKLT